MTRKLYKGTPESRSQLESSRFTDRQRDTPAHTWAGPLHRWTGMSLVSSSSWWACPGCLASLSPWIYSLWSLSSQTHKPSSSCLSIIYKEMAPFADERTMPEKEGVHQDYIQVSTVPKCQMFLHTPVFPEAQHSSVLITHYSVCQHPQSLNTKIFLLLLLLFVLLRQGFPCVAQAILELHL